MALHTAVVQKDLALKHQRMADSPRSVSRHLCGGNTRWLERETVAMAEATVRDWKPWIRYGPGSSAFRRRLAENALRRRRPC